MSVSSSNNDVLTPVRLHALFDILTHHQTYAEVDVLTSGDPDSCPVFPDPSTLPTTSSRPSPFSPPANEADRRDGAAVDIQVPLVNLLHTDFILKLPMLRNLPADFWTGKAKGLFSRLYIGSSYDKATVGIRRMVASLTASAVAALARGRVGGYARRGDESRAGHYDPDKAADLERAWHDLVDGLVYGDTIDELYDALAQFESVEEHSEMVRVVVDYISIQIATLLHRVFVVAPEGQMLARMAENAHKLTPYRLTRQTLRASNAATLMSAMTKLLLAKVSLASLGNWAGVTNIADDGNNLLQRILSTLIKWDAAEFKKTADKIVAAGDAPHSDVLTAISNHVRRPASEHARTRNLSIVRSESIVTTILSAAPPPSSNALDWPPKLSELHHEQCLAYYSALLSASDRDGLAGALCKTAPDHFTGLVRDTMGVFEPLIRSAHAAMDLGQYMSELHAVLDDLLAVARMKDGQASPGVAEFVAVVRKHQRFWAKWTARFAKGCPEIWSQYREWSKESIMRFRVEDGSFEGSTPAVASPLMRDRLAKLFAALPDAQRDEFLPILDAHAVYLADVRSASTARMQSVLDAAGKAGSESVRASSAEKKTGLFNFAAGASKKTKPAAVESNPRVMAGPGIYLARGQALMNDTPITPATPHGGLRTGKDVKEGGARRGVLQDPPQDPPTGGGAVAPVPMDMDVPRAVDILPVVRALGKGFYEVVEMMRAVEGAR